MKVSLRVLLKNKHFTLINLFGLIIGITSFILILSWVRHELSYDSFHSKKERIYQLTIKYPNGIIGPNTPYAIAPSLADKYPEIAAYTHVRRLSANQNYSFTFFPETDRQVKAYESRVVKVNSSFFDIFDFKQVWSSGGELFGQPGSVILSSRVALTYFGDQNPVGQTIEMNNQELLTVTGVVEIPENTYFKFDFFLLETDNLSNNWNWADPAYVLLYPGMDIEKFKEQISTFFTENSPYTQLEGEHVLQILPINEVYLTFKGKQQVFIFSCIGLLLLVMAALNYMNLASANYVNRITEAGVRKVLGAGKRRLRKIIFTETYILAFVATIISLFFAEIILQKSEQIIGSKLEIGYLDHPIILLVILAAVFLTISIASMYPSLLFFRGNVVNSAKNIFNTGRKGQVFILITVLLQFTLTIILLISAFVIRAQTHYVINEDLGFSIENTLSIPLNPDIRENYPALMERLTSYPGIEEVSMGMSVPYNSEMKTNIDWIQNSTNDKGVFHYSICLRNYPELFEMEAVQGRLFSDEIVTDQEKYLINESAASLMGFENPIGKNISMWGLKGDIVGVVKDFHHVSLHREIGPYIFNVNPRAYGAMKYMFIKMSARADAETISFIKSVCEEFSTEWPFTYSSMKNEISDLYRQDLMLIRIIGLFLFLTIFLSVLSIYGLAYHSMEKKTKEITIRKVYGAELMDNLILTFKRLLFQIGLSFIIAIPLAVILMNKWLTNFAYSIKLKAVYFIIPLLIALLVAIITSFLAMWKTINKNPVENLKQN